MNDKNKDLLNRLLNKLYGKTDEELIKELEEDGIEYKIIKSNEK